MNVMAGARTAFLNHRWEPHIDDNGELGKKHPGSLVIMELLACLNLPESETNF